MLGSGKTSKNPVSWCFEPSQPQRIRCAAQPCVVYSDTSQLEEATCVTCVCV